MTNLGLRTLGLIHKYQFITNVAKTTMNRPFGNGSYDLLMVIRGMVYYWLNHIIVIGNKFRKLGYNPQNYAEIC